MKFKDDDPDDDDDDDDNHLDPPHLHLGHAPFRLKGVEVGGEGEHHVALGHSHLVHVMVINDINIQDI